MGEMMEKDVTMTSGPADYITLDDVTRSFITANADAFDNGIYRPRAGTVKRFVTGVADAFKENLKLKDSLMIFGGQGAMMVGGVFGEDSSLSSWGREIVRAGSRQIAAIDAENAKNSDLTDYEKDTFAYKLGSGSWLPAPPSPHLRRELSCLPLAPLRPFLPEASAY